MDEGEETKEEKGEKEEEEDEREETKKEEEEDDLYLPELDLDVLQEAVLAGDELHLGERWCEG